MNNTKICSKCNEEKPISEFYKNKQYKDNLHCYCKDCCKLLSKQNYIKKHGQPKRKEYKLNNIYAFRFCDNNSEHFKPVCRILEKHNDELKDDSERLSTDFIKSLLGIDENVC